MIAKRVERKDGGKKRFGSLAGYILDVKHQGEKLTHSWRVNCLADTHELAVKEIEATQSLNQRSKKDKTYHLIVSFQVGENPEKSVLERIEKIFAEKIGFGEHQRLAAVHNDTDNLHFHVAINKIHPKSFRAFEPHFDKLKIDEACKECELKFGLKRDNRISHKQAQEKSRSTQKTKDMEAHSGLESFQAFTVKNAKPALESVLGSEDATWDNVLVCLARFDLELRKRGSGLVISHRKEKLFVKASSVSREFGKQALEARLGPFVHKSLKVECEMSYQKTPGHPGSNRLYEEYLDYKNQKKQQYKDGLLALKKQRAQAYEDIMRRARDRRMEVKLDPIIAKSKKIDLYKIIYSQTSDQISRLDTTIKEAREVLIMERGVIAWRPWLVSRAEQGETRALEALRVGQTAVKQGFDNKIYGYDPGKKLFSLSGLRRCIKQSGDVEYTKGDLKIVDHGGKVSVNKSDQASVDLALRLARIKFGTKVQFVGSNKFLSACHRHSGLVATKTRTQDRSLARGMEH